MICKACGATLPEGAHFCPDCGTPVPLLPDLAFDPEPAKAAELPELMPDPAPAKAAELPELIPDPEPPKPAPLMEVAEPTAPLYVPTEPEPVYAQPVYDDPAQAIPQGEVDSILIWGIAGLACSFLITILGIIFSAIAMSKAKRMRAAYGFLPRRAGTGRALGIAGLITSIVITVLALLFVIFIVAVIAYGVSFGEFYYY